MSVLPASKTDTPRLAVLGNGVWSRLALAESGEAPEMVPSLVALRTAIASGALLVAFTSGNVLGAAPIEFMLGLTSNLGLVHHDVVLHEEIARALAATYPGLTHSAEALRPQLVVRRDEPEVAAVALQAARAGAGPVAPLEDAVLVSGLAAAAARHSIPMEQLQSWLAVEAQADAFFAALPSLRVTSTLLAALGAEEEPALAPVDAAELTVLRLGLPYANLVVTEAPWVDVIEQLGLAAAHDVKVCVPADIPAALRELGCLPPAD